MSRRAANQDVAVIDDDDHQGATKYRPLFARQIYELRLLGLTDEQIGKVFDVTTQTIGDWQKKYPAFAKRYREGGVLADGPVVSALRKRALGYSYRTQKPTPVWDRETKSHKVIVVEVEETLPPDVNAAKYWLAARHSGIWGDKKQVELGGIAGKPLQVEDVSAREFLTRKLEGLRQRQLAMADEEPPQLLHNGKDHHHE